MALILPRNVRGPILDLALPANASSTFILLRNKTTGRDLGISLPAGWAGEDLSLDFFRKTARDQSGADRSALISAALSDLWTEPSGFVTGANVVDVQAYSGAAPKTVTNNWITTPVGPNGVASNATHIFWTDNSKKAIGRAKIDGTEPLAEFISGLTAPFQVAVDATYIYWCDEATGKIGRAKLNGTSVEKEWLNTGVTPEGLAVNANYIFYVNLATGNIGRAKIDGTSHEKEWIKAASIGYTLLGCAVDSRYLYFGGNAVGTIGRVRLDGSGLEKDWITTPATLTGLAVDAGSVYWLDGTAGKIGRANIDGSSPNSAWFAAAGGGQPSVAVANDYLYLAEFSNTSIGRATLKSAFAVTATLRWEKGYF